MKGGRFIMTDRQKTALNTFLFEKCVDELPSAYYIEPDNGCDYCEKCADHQCAIEEDKCGGPHDEDFEEMQSFPSWGETEHVKFCEDCEKPLEYSLVFSGIDDELGFFEQYGVDIGSNTDRYAIRQISEDVSEDVQKRLYQIIFGGGEISSGTANYQ